MIWYGRHGRVANVIFAGAVSFGCSTDSDGDDIFSDREEITVVVNVDAAKPLLIDTNDAVDTTIEAVIVEVERIALTRETGEVIEVEPHPGRVDLLADDSIELARDVVPEDAYMRIHLFFTESSEVRFADRREVLTIPNLAAGLIYVHEFCIDGAPFSLDLDQIGFTWSLGGDLLQDRDTGEFVLRTSGLDLTHTPDC